VLYERLGGGKRDDISGLRGADVVDANNFGQDRDVLEGGRGGDRLLSNDGDPDDTVRGGAGRDICYVDVGRTGKRTASKTGKKIGKRTVRRGVKRGDSRTAGSTRAGVGRDAETDARKNVLGPTGPEPTYGAPVRAPFCGPSQPSTTSSNSPNTPACTGSGRTAAMRS
jgi:Ca2+-binding RTX toxin-like protein